MRLPPSPAAPFVFSGSERVFSSGRGYPGFVSWWKTVQGIVGTWSHPDSRAVLIARGWEVWGEGAGTGHRGSGVLSCLLWG